MGFYGLNHLFCVLVVNLPTLAFMTSAQVIPSLSTNSQRQNCTTQTAQPKLKAFQ